MNISPTDWLILAWLFALGGTVGSFLNVVVYRLPAGMSVAAPPSHCPACKRPIRWYDNVPILAWLWLKGRCRDCGTRISARYPAVEAVTAGLFVLLGALEPVGGGMNLPGGAVQPGDGAASVLHHPVGLWAIYGYHLLLLCTLLCACLIAWDGRGVPLRLYAPAIIVGVSAPLAWPWLHPAPAAAGWSGWIGGLATTVAGGVSGAAMGWLATRPVPGEQRAGLAIAAVSIGLFLGWQAGLALGLAAALAVAAGWLAGGGKPGFPRLFGFVALGTGAFVWIVAWAWIDAWLHLPG